MWSLLFTRKSSKIAGEVFYRHVVLARCQCPISSENTEGKGQIKMMMMMMMMMMLIVIIARRPASADRTARAARH